MKFLYTNPIFTLFHLRVKTNIETPLVARSCMSSVPMNTHPHCMHGLLFDVQVYCCCDDDDPDEGLASSCDCSLCCDYCCDLSATPKQPPTLSPIVGADDRSSESFVRRPCSSRLPSGTKTETVEAAEMPLTETVGGTANKHPNTKKSNTHGGININQSLSNNNKDRGAAAGITSSNKRLPPIGKAISLG